MKKSDKPFTRITKKHALYPLIAKLYMSGMNLTRICHIFHLRYENAWSIIKYDKSVPKREFNVLTDGQKDEVVKMYMDGVSVPDIQEKFNTTARKVYYTLKRRGIKANRVKNYPRPYRTEEEKRAIAEAYRDSGGKVYEVIKKFNINNPVTVYKILKPFNMSSERPRTFHVTRTEEECQEVVKAYMDGEKIVEIVKKFNLKTTNTLYAIIDKNGVHRRRNRDS